MAVISIARADTDAWIWETVTGSDTGEPIKLPRGGGQVAVHAFGTFGDTLTIQGSIDGTNWFTLLTGPGGTAVTFTADGYAEITTAARYVRPSAGASITDVDVLLHLVV